MSYQVIARKYRPQTFEEVVGQRPIVTTLKNAVAQRRVHHAYLFSGPRGVGKTTVARLLAKSLNCAEGPTPRPCNACASCGEIAQSRSMDVLEIDGASNRGIENIRELRETVRYAPARDRYKVFIIDEVHMLTDPAWNALLKTLEEPPPQVVFVFATTEYREIPRTILSRCQHFEFRKVSASDLTAHLRQVAAGEKVTVEPSVFDLIARVAEGSLRDALSALDQVIAFSGAAVTDEQARTILGVVDRELIVDFFTAVRGRDCGRIVELVDTVFEKGYQPVEFLEDLLAHGRDLLLARTVPDPGRFLSATGEEAATLAARAAEFSEDELLRILELMTREEPRIRNSSHARFMLEALGIKLARLADLRSIEDLLARLETPGAGLAAGPGPGTKPGPNVGPGRGSAPGGAPPRGPGASSPTTHAAPVAAPAGGPAARFDGAAIAEPAVATPPPLAGSDAPPAGDSLVAAILRRIHDERGAIGAMLEQAAWIRADGDLLAIAFAARHAFFRDKVQGRETADYLRRVARAVAGRDLVLQVVGTEGGASVAGGAGDRPSPPAAPPRRSAAIPVDRGAAPRAAAALLDNPDRRALVDRAMQEPVMRSVIDLFGGEIIDIEPV
jgi:DNA polymerase-3 subunit gamma/tau